MSAVAAVLTAGGLLALGYVLVGYPVLLAVRARWWPHCVVADREAPPLAVSVLISAFNESRHLRQKIESLWRVDYPGDCLDVWLADDGSSDGTRALAEELAAAPEAAGRLHLLPATENLGKPSQLNRLAAAATGEVLVFADARQVLDPAAIRELVSCFADATVGGVSGAIEYRTPDDQPVAIGAYWRYESQLRDWEGRIHSSCGGVGPLHAIRRELFLPFPPETVLDDMLGPLRIVLRGWRFVYNGAAKAYETFSMKPRHEFDRRVRTLAGTYQLLRLEPRLLLPWRNPIWWQFVSHRVGRLLVPWCLLAMLLGSILGSPHHAGFKVALVVQLLGYAYGLVGWRLAGTPRAPKGSSIAYNLLLLAAVALAGLWRDLRGGSTGRWGAKETHRR